MGDDLTVAAGDGGGDIAMAASPVLVARADDRHYRTPSTSCLSEQPCGAALIYQHMIGGHTRGHAGSIMSLHQANHSTDGSITLAALTALPSPPSSADVFWPLQPDTQSPSRSNSTLRVRVRVQVCGVYPRNNKELHRSGMIMII
ncbi:hypothetical protein AOLI_G00192900 [Acnodon oligacanthus]